jgi:hypothetical protein
VRGHTPNLNTHNRIYTIVSTAVRILRTELRSHEELLAIIRSLGSKDLFAAGQAMRLFRHLALPLNHLTTRFTEGIFDIALYIAISLEDSNYETQVVGLELLSVMAEQYGESELTASFRCSWDDVM